MAKKGEDKKPVLVRVRLPSYLLLLEQAGQESVARGVPVSVPMLIAEGIEEKLAGKGIGAGLGGNKKKG